MKRYSEYEPAELAALDDAGVQRLIDIELVYHEIVPVPIPEEPTLADVGIEKKDVGFRVGGNYGLIFKNLEDAQAVARLPMLTEKYKYEIGYEHKWLEPVEDVSVESVPYLVKEEVLRLGVALKENKNRQAEYQRQRDAHDKYLEETSGIRNEVWEAVSKARKQMCAIESALHTFSKYKDLADGDETVAAKFFRNTYKDQPDMIQAVLGDEPPEESHEEAAG